MCRSKTVSEEDHALPTSVRKSRRLMNFTPQVEHYPTISRERQVRLHRGKIDRIPNYSITSSASDSRLSEIFTPSALAVFMLITIRNFVACMIGKSAGLAPLRISPA